MEKGDKLTGGPYWTQNWIEAMWRFTAERFVDFDTGNVDFEALGREEYEFRKALFFRNFKNSPRAMEAFDAAADDYSKKVANGQKGGRPRKNTEETQIAEATAPSAGGSCATNEARDSQPVRPGRNSRYPNSREEFHAFVADNNLHEGLAEEWYAIHEARGWVDENGNPIKNWRGALKNYCIKIEQKRRTA